MHGYNVQVGPMGLTACGQHVHHILDGLPAPARAQVALTHADPAGCVVCLQESPDE